MTATAARASAGAAEARPGRTPSGVRCTELYTRAAGPGLPHGVGHRGHSPGRGAADRGRRPRWTGSPRRPGAAGRVPRADPAPQRAGGDAPQRRGRTGAQGERRGEDPAVHRRVTARRAARAAALRGGRRSRRRRVRAGRECCRTPATVRRARPTTVILRPRRGASHACSHATSAGAGRCGGRPNTAPAAGRGGARRLPAGSAPADRGQTEGGNGPRRHRRGPWPVTTPHGIVGPTGGNRPVTQGR